MEGKATVVRVQEGDLLEELFQLRRVVFVQEQGVAAEEEFDEYESVSVHFAAVLDGEVVACARYRVTTSGFKIERMAVRLERRGQGLGSLVLRHVLEVLNALPSRSLSPVYLHAQVQALGFYLKHGFVPEGDEFEEAGIGHFRCCLRDTGRAAPPKVCR